MKPILATTLVVGELISMTRDTQMNKKLSTNALALIKEQLLELGKVKTVGKVVRNSSFRRIPSVRMFEVMQSKFNPILEKLGIKLKLPREYKYSVRETNSMNRYMKFQILKIRSLCASNHKAKA